MYHSLPIKRCCLGIDQNFSENAVLLVSEKREIRLYVQIQPDISGICQLSVLLILDHNGANLSQVELSPILCNGQPSVIHIIKADKIELGDWNVTLIERDSKCCISDFTFKVLDTTLLMPVNMEVWIQPVFNTVPTIPSELFSPIVRISLDSLSEFTLSVPLNIKIKSQDGSTVYEGTHLLSFKDSKAVFSLPDYTADMETLYGKSLAIFLGGSELASSTFCDQTPQRMFRMEEMNGQRWLNKIGLRTLIENRDTEQVCQKIRNIVDVGCAAELIPFLHTLSERTDFDQILIAFSNCGERDVARALYKYATGGKNPKIQDAAFCVIEEIGKRTSSVNNNKREQQRLQELDNQVSHHLVTEDITHGESNYIPDMSTVTKLTRTEKKKLPKKIQKRIDEVTAVDEQALVEIHSGMEQCIDLFLRLVTMLKASPDFAHNQLGTLENELMSVVSKSNLSVKDKKSAKVQLRHLVRKTALELDKNMAGTLEALPELLAQSLIVEGFISSVIKNRIESILRDAIITEESIRLEINQLEAIYKQVLMAVDKSDLSLPEKNRIKKRFDEVLTEVYQRK